MYLKPYQEITVEKSALRITISFGDFAAEYVHTEPPINT